MVSIEWEDRPNWYKVIRLKKRLMPRGIFNVGGSGVVVMCFLTMVKHGTVDNHEQHHTQAKRFNHQWPTRRRCCSDEDIPKKMMTRRTICLTCFHGRQSCQKGDCIHDASLPFKPSWSKDPCCAGMHNKNIEKETS